MRSRHFALSALLVGCGAGASRGAGAVDASAAAPGDADETLGAAACDLAAPVRDGDVRYGESLARATDTAAGCLGALRAIAYRVTVPAGRTLTARVPRADGPVVLQIVTDCAATRCLAQSSTAGVAPLRAVWRNDGPQTEVRVLAGSFSRWEGRFAISFALEDSPANLRCEDAEALEDGSWRAEQRPGADPTARAVCTDRPAPAAAGLRWYRATIPPRSVAVATLTPGPALPGREYGLVAVMRDDCATDRCAAATASPLRARGSLVGANDSDAPRALRLGVGVYPPLAEGSFSLALAMRPRPAESRCESAAALPLDADVTGDTTASPDAPPRCADGPAAGTANFFAVTIPPGRFFEAVATTTGPAPLSLRALDGCAATTCLAASAATQPATLRVPNTTNAPRRVVVAVGARDADAQAGYTLRGSLVDADPAGRCEGAVTFAPGRSMLTDTWRVAANGPACGNPGAYGPARWIRVTVAPNTALRVTASPVSDGEDISPTVLRAVDACDAAGCVAPGANPVVLPNDTDAPREYRVAVGAATPGFRGTLTLYSAQQGIARNGRCDRATQVSAGAPVRREDASIALPGAAGCAPAQTVYARWYAATVPPGEVLHAWTASPFSPFSSAMPGLSVRGTCDGACEAASGAQGNRGTHVWWRNTDVTPRTARIQAAWPGLSGAAYDLSVESFAPAPNGRCVDAEDLPLPAARTLPALRGDATATPCAPDNRSPVAWYRATVDPGRALRVSVSAATASPPQRLTVSVLDACDATACLATTSAATSGSAAWRNDSVTPRAVRVALHAADNAPLTGITLSAAQE